jgi:outer membrane biosynthesis protein TonB
MTVWSRSACLIAALVAASLNGCQAPQKPPEAAAPAPAPAPTPKLAPAPVVAQQAPASAAEAPKPAPKPRAPAKKRAPKPKPAPVVAQPAPPPPPPQPNPDEERKRKLDAWIAAIGRSTIAFNPPSPVQVGQSADVKLALTPPAETAALADDLRKSLADPAAWTPRMRARLAGGDFAITPAEAKDADLPASGPVEWRWSAVPSAAGTKKLVATLSFALPPGMGTARELPPVSREVVVEATLWSRIGDYWMWIVAAIVAFVAILWWAMRRRGAA